MVMEFTVQVDEVERDWSETDPDTTARMVRALDAFSDDARARERARTVGLGRVLLLAIGVAMLLAIGLAVHDLIAGTVQSIDRGM